MNVLAVSQSPAVRERIVGLLASIERVEMILHSHELTRALEFVRRYRPRAVVVDAHLPGGDGLSLVRRLRHEFPHIAVLTVGDADDDAYRRHHESLGARYIEKGAPYQRMLATLAAVLGTDQRDDLPGDGSPAFVGAAASRTAATSTPASESASRIASSE